MTTRSNRYNKGHVTVKSVNAEQRMLLKNYDAYMIDDWYDYGGNVEPRIYRLKEVESLIDSNTYLCRSLEQNLESAFGKNFTDDTDEKVLEALDFENLMNMGADYLYYGDVWNELTILNNEIIYVNNSPAQSWNHGKLKYKGMGVQFAGTKKELILPMIDWDLFEKGRHPSGVFMDHIKFGRKIYGKPTWRACMETVKFLKYSMEDISAFYENDCIPYSIVVGYGMATTPEEQDEMSDYLEQNFQGAKEKRKAMIVMSTQPKTEAELEVKELEKKILTREVMDLRNMSHFEICAACGTPYWLLGLTKAGAMGQSNERRVELKFYISEVIQPIQRVFTERFKKYFGDIQIEFNTLEFPEIEEPAFDFMQAQKADLKSYIADAMNELTLNYEQGNCKTNEGD